MAEEQQVTAVNSLDNNNLKRKLEDLEQPPSADVAAPYLSDENAEDEPSKRPRFDELGSENGDKPDADNGHTEENAETAVDEADCDESSKEATLKEESEPQPVSEVEHKDGDQTGSSEEVDAQTVPSVEAQQENTEKKAGEETQEPTSEVAARSTSGSKKIEIPTNKVGVLIGKSGDTIRFLQINSGAKIQITKDADANPGATTRTVEIEGTPGCINKAEKLIKEVIKEADAGGSPFLVARGLSAALTAGAIEVEMPVPGDKIGLIIGKGGETIRNLQTRSGARIQLIPQNSPGDGVEQDKEKKVKITGDYKQVEFAKELIKEVMNQLPGKPSRGNSYSKQSYPPGGPSGAPQWASHGPPTQPMPYNYNQRGPYPSHNYPAQSHGNYPYHGPQRSSFNSGWDNRPPTQAPPHSGGYDYYGQRGGNVANPSGPSMAAPPHTQANYNHGQPRGANYAHPAPYSQTAPPTQNYGQAPAPQPYLGQGYPPQQQQYATPPPYNMPSQGPPQGYAPPTASQPMDTPYQAPPILAPQPYAQNVQPQQQYLYAPGPTSQPPYGSVPVTNDAYTQQPTGYSHPGPAYGPQTGGYAVPTGGYGHYPPQAAQPGYVDQTTAPIAAAGTSAAGYGYQGQVNQPAYATGQAYGATPAPAAQPAYGATPAPAPAPAAQPAYGTTQAPAAQPAYGATQAPAAQPAYVQPVATQTGYEQLAAQAGAYASASAAAATPAQPAAYATQQMYAAPR